MKKITRILTTLMLVGTIIFTTTMTTYGGTIYNVKCTVTYNQTEARKIYKKINDFRTGSNAWYWNENNTKKIRCKNLSELKYDYNLEKVAMKRAAEIALSFDHKRPADTRFFYAYDECKVKYTAAGENIAAGHENASAVHISLVESNDKYNGQGHRRCMLDEHFNAVGIASVKVNGICYWVEEFACIESPNRHRTAAVNTAKTVSTKLSSSLIESKKLIKPSSITMTKGKSIAPRKLSAKVETYSYFGHPGGMTIRPSKVDYKIGNRKIAKIKDGKIVALKKGTTTITYKALGRSVKTKLTVK